MTKESSFHQEAQIEQFKSVIQISALALRSAMITNGGAAIALLTFLGNMKDSSGMACFVNALQYYITGVALAALATGTSYLAQYRYLHELKSSNANAYGKYITYLTIAIVFSSYAVFVFGGLEASNGFSERI